jgi:hypothetical protein
LDTVLFFKEPLIKDFFVDNSDILELCDIYLVSLHLNAANNTLVAEYTMPDYLNDDDAEKVRPLLKKIIYRWNGVRFVKE